MAAVLTETPTLSAQARLVRAILRRAKGNPLLVGNLRATALVVRSHLRMFPAPAGIRFRREIINGIPVEIAEPIGHWPRRRMLYLHGGGYVMCNPRTHRNFAARLALACDASVWIPDYRLAPRHPYPAALDDAELVWREFAAANPVQDTILGGDSAGGGLSVALCYRLRDQGEKLPDRLYLLSPWLDLTHAGDSHRRCAHLDPMISTGWIEQDCARHYAGYRDRTNPEISPLFGDPTGLPPTYIQTGTHEILLDDSRRFEEKAAQAGVRIGSDYGEGLWHVWPITAPFAPESRTAIETASRWLTADLAG